MVSSPSAVNLLTAATEQLYKNRLSLVAEHTREVMSEWAEHKKVETQDRVLQRIQENLEIAESKYDELRDQMEQEFHQLRTQLDHTRSLHSSPKLSLQQPRSPLLNSLADKLRLEARETGYKRVERRLREREAKRIFDEQQQIMEAKKYRREQAKLKIQKEIDLMKDDWTEGVADLLKSYFFNRLELIRLDAFDCYRIGGENALWEFVQQFVWNVDSEGRLDWLAFEHLHCGLFPGFYSIANRLKEEVEEDFISYDTLETIRKDALNDVFDAVASDCHALIFDECINEGDRRIRLLQIENDMMIESDDVSHCLEEEGFFNDQHMKFIAEMQQHRAELLEAAKRDRLQKEQELKMSSVRDAEEMLRQAEEQMRSGDVEGLGDDFFEREKELIRMEIAKREASLNEEASVMDKEEETVRVKRIAERRLLQEDKKRQKDVRKREREQKEVETKLRARLLEGGVFLKHGKKGKPHHRFIWVSSDFSAIQWRDPAKTKVRDSMQVASITDVVVGQTTSVFRRRSGNPGREALSFSVIAGERTLDVEAASEEDRDLWVDSFRYLVSLVHPGFGGFNKQQ
ncbi:hypothetical protein GEMRC1_005131 [Eukaryota sp. GEM-RC1]